jgi:hypothetical protein
MLHNGIIRAFSFDPLLNGSCWTTESSQHSHVNSSWMTRVALWSHHSIIMWTSLECLMLDYGIITAISHELLLNGSSWTMESSQHCHVNSSWMIGSCQTMEPSQHSLVNSSWMAHVGLCNHHFIVAWTPPEWMAHVRLCNHHIILTWTSPEWICHVKLWIHHSILSWTPPEWLMLDYGIITAFSPELLLNEWLV